MYKVMIRDNMHPIAKEILESTGQIKVVVDNDKKNNDPGVLSELIGEFHGLAVRSGTKVTKEVQEKATNLKVIGRAGIGVDNIDINAATNNGIVVMNAPGGNTVTTAEHAISLMLSLARNIPQATASIRAGEWAKKRLMGVEITGKKLGIVGLGQIGRIVAQKAKGLGMKILASDPYVSKEAAESMGVELMTLDALYAESDFISLHVPSLKETVNMINKDTIAKMRKGVRIINCSRGNVVDIDDLYQAVLNEHVAGAALDVYPKEPPDYTMPLFQDQRIIFTPHLGASTDEAQFKVAEIIAREMADYLLNGVIVNAINFPSIPLEEMERLTPYLNLAEKMGSCMGQLIRNLHDITITYSGNVTEMETKPMTHAVLKGVLGSYTDKPVNYVSAPMIAHAKGIHFNETTTRKPSDFGGHISVRFEGSESGPNEIWGTIFEKKYPRIVRLGKIYMDAVPEGSMIIIQNFDKPGVIGNVGTTLGKHNINIARFHLGRRDDLALCMVNIDMPADEGVLEEIRQLPNIISARQVILD